MATDPLAKYATAPEWLDDARQAMQALYGAAAGHPNANVIERNVARINEALKRVPFSPLNVVDKQLIDLVRKAQNDGFPYFCLECYSGFMKECIHG